MRVSPPQSFLPTYQGGPVLSKYWVDWLRELWQSAGWSDASPVYDDLPAQFLGSPSTAVVSGGLQGLELSAGADTSIPFMAKLPNWYKNGSALVPYADWVPSTTGAGNALLRVGYSVAGYGDTLAAESELDSAVAAPGTVNQIARTSFAEISGTDFVRDDVILGKIERVGTGAADTYGGSVVLVSVGLKIRREGIGWETPHP